MTYQQTVLNDKPAGFWMITAASGTSETDLSGNSKTATITEATDLIDRGYRPLVTGTSTDRAYRFYSGNHKLTYPTLEIWEKGRNHIPFSVEFTVQPITSRRRVDLFAPQEASSASVPDNGIFLENGRLYFSVSNGSASSVTTIKSVASTWLSTGTTYHVVAVYSVASVALYVDGVLADSAPVDPGISWPHTTANFITTAYSLSSDTVSSSFLFDAVSVYRAELSPTAINNHYVMSTPNLSETEIVNSLGGKIIQLNDGDRIKAFDYSAKENGWSSNLNTITNLVQNDDGSIGLKKIKPLKMYNTSLNYNNILTQQQADGSGDWIMQGGQGTITTTTAQAFTGTNSMEFVSNGTNTGAAISPGYYGLINFPNAGGKVFTHTAWVRAELAGRQASLTFLSYDGVWVGQATNYSVSLTPVALTAGVWTQISLTTAALPAKTGSLGVQVVYSVVGGGLQTNGEKAWIDQASVHEGSSTIYRAPNTGPAFVTNQDISSRPRNVLVWGGATAEEAYSGMVISNTNQSLARVSTDFYSGSNSWQVTSTGAGASVLSLTHSGVPVEPGRTYTQMFKVKPTVTARNVQQYVNWYDSSNTLIGNSGTVGTATTLNTWSTVRRVIIAPPKAVKGDFYIQTTANMVTGDIFYFDEIGLIEGDVTQWVAPTFNSGPYEFSSKEFKYASMERVGEILGADQGAIGTFALFTTASNDDVQEQVVLSVSSSSQNHILEVVKKADKNLYIRYIYKNTSGVITTTETSWGAISSLLGGLPYIYLEWGGGLASLYVNSTSSPAQIAFDAGIPSPRFDSNSYMNLGAGFDGTRPWNNYFRTTKIYDKVQPATEFNFNKTVIDGRIIKFEGNLNVSQVGALYINTATGTDGTLTNSSTTQSRVSYDPVVTGASVGTSFSNVNNLLTYNQATGGESGTTTGWQGDNATVAAYLLDKYSGAASIEATSTSAVRVGIQTNTAAWAVAPGQVYTITCAVKSALTTLTGSAKFTVFDSVGGYLTDVGVTINTTGGGWNVFTGQVTIPANGYSVTFNPYLQTPIVGTKVYFDQMGFWLGTETTWGEPYQTVTNGSELIPSIFPGVLPARYYAKTTLTTDDSYYAPVKLNDIKLEAFVNNKEVAENSWDELASGVRSRIYPDNSPEVRQNLYGGAYINGIANGLYVLPVNDTNSTGFPDGGTAYSTAGPAALIRTAEFWVYPETQGYYIYHDGATEYSMRYLDSGGFTTTGFTTLYVDGASVSNGATSTTWYNRWHHIVLTNASAQININTDLPYGVNLLTANQASVETDLTGLTFGGGGSSAIARSTTKMLHGLASAAITTSSAAAAGVWSGGTLGNKTNVVAGKTYTVSGWVLADTISRTANIYIYFYDSNGTGIGGSTTGTNISTSTSEWRQVSATATAPAGATKADLVAFTSGGVAAEINYWDQLAMYEGGLARWSLPGETPGINLLTSNQASAGDTLSSLLGFTNHGGTITYDTAQRLIGAGSMKSSAVTPQRHSISTTAFPTYVTPGKTYTAVFSVRSGAAPTGGYDWACYIEWDDATGAAINSVATGRTVTQDVWAQISHTAVAPVGAVTARMVLYRNAAAGGAAEDAWMDNIAFYEGTGTSASPAGDRLRLGVAPPGQQQGAARYQNISYYPQTFDAGMVTTNYKAYLGDMTGGGATDYANMLTLNQATAETDTTGMTVTFNPGTLTYTYTAASDQFYSGSKSFKLAFTSGTGVSQVNFGAPNGVSAFRVQPSTTYTAVARVRCTAARVAQLSIDWWTAAGTYISSSASGGAVVANTWESRTSTATSPSTAAYGTITVALTNPSSGDSYWFDELGLWTGSATTWVSPASVGTRAISDTAPAFFNDIWTTETIKIR